MHVCIRSTFCCRNSFPNLFSGFLTLHKIRLWLQHFFNFQPDPWRNGIQFDENILNHQLVTGGTEKNMYLQSKAIFSQGTDKWDPPNGKETENHRLTSAGCKWDGCKPWYGWYIMVKLLSPYNWVGFHPLYTLQQPGARFFHCSQYTLTNMSPENQWLEDVFLK